MISSILLFMAAGAAEIIGGYMVWIWIREGASLIIGTAGFFILCIYGFIPTLQQASFGRVYAAYGGVFIVMSMLWGYAADGTVPDRWDLAGSILALSGAGLIMWGPRSS